MGALLTFLAVFAALIIAIALKLRRSNLTLTDDIDYGVPPPPKAKKETSAVLNYAALHGELEEAFQDPPKKKRRPARKTATSKKPTKKAVKKPAKATARTV
jgi:hypothetical protein